MKSKGCAAKLHFGIFKATYLKKHSGGGGKVVAQSKKDNQNGTVPFRESLSQWMYSIQVLTGAF